MNSIHEEILKFKASGKEKNCCPICGYEFDLSEIETDVFKCHDCGSPDAEELTKDMLIYPWDDYLWVM